VRRARRARGQDVQDTGATELRGGEIAGAQVGERGLEAGVCDEVQKSRRRVQEASLTWNPGAAGSTHNG
jgi:hypothetical protein